MTARRPYLVFAGAVAVLLLAWLFLLWKPKTEELQAARERREQAEEQATTLRSRVRTLEAASQRRAELELARTALERAIPGEPDVPEFLLAADAVAKEAGVDFVSVAPGSPSPPSGGMPAGIGLTVAVSGRYFAVLDYLNRLLSMDRLVVLDAVQVTPQGSGAAPTLLVNLRGRMYTTAAPAPPAGTTATAPSAPATTPTTAGANG